MDDFFFFLGKGAFYKEMQASGVVTPVSSCYLFPASQDPTKSQVKFYLLYEAFGKNKNKNLL